MSDKPIPEVSDAGRPYWAAAENGELQLQKCLSCGRYIFYPRHWCPFCLKLDLTWERVSGRAEVYSFSIVHQSPMESYQAPYALAIVSLPEGPRMMTNIVNCDVADVRVGMPVRVTFEKRSGGFTVPQFEPDLDQEGVE